MSTSETTTIGSGGKCTNIFNKNGYSLVFFENGYVRWLRKMATEFNDKRFREFHKKWLWILGRKR
jgi:hypothetical protein